ncbi:MAG: hypothetical protein ACK5LP_06110 [Campylobacteraceae bacterium]
MFLNEIYYCNICGKSTDKAPNTIFIKGVYENEEIHVCTSCIPAMVHGDGKGVVSNNELKKELNKK